MSDIKTYLPPTAWYNEEEDQRPLIYLTGSLYTNNNWQQKAEEIIYSLTKDVVIANPRSPEWFENKDANYDDGTQKAWELYHIRMASACGAVMFWLAKDSKNDNEAIFQAAEWLQNLKYRKIHQPERPLKLIIGIEEGFCLEKYMAFRILEDLPGFGFYDTLENTCAGTVRVLGGGEY